MSTSWYKSRIPPKLIQAFLQQTKNHGRLCVEVWETTCIVTNFQQLASVLINPANPSLSGVSKFPYFPKGGPEPKFSPNKDAHPIMGYVTSWGGMDVGKGMMFSANVVDGLVHQLGGKALAQELQSHGSDGNEIIVNEGQAVWTSGVGDYSYLVHTVPPFFDNNDAKQANRLLQDCYHNSLQLASSKLQETTKDTIRIASPLLGAGCRGFPLEDAVDHCVQALCDFQSDQKLTLAFGIPTEQVRNILLESLRDSDFVPVSTDGTQL